MRFHLIRQKGCSQINSVIKLCLIFILVLVGSVACGKTRDEFSAKVPPSCHIIQHAAGETCVPNEPQRVIALDQAAMDNMLALGQSPIGVATADFYRISGVPVYLAEELKEVSRVGDRSSPNLETILNIKPDLIVGSHFVHHGIYNRLSSIAPTVMIDGNDNSWRDNFSLVADSIGKKQEAVVKLQDFDTRIDNLQTEIGQGLEDIEVSIVASFPAGFRVFGKDYFMGQIIDEVGLSRPSHQIEGNSGWGLESIELIDGDVMFWLQHSSGPWAKQRSPIQELIDEQNSLWTSLKAVRMKKVYEVDIEIWMGGRGIHAAHLILDDLFKYLAD